MPLEDLEEHPDKIGQLQQWMKSYRPEELFDERGGLRGHLADLRPKGSRRMGTNSHANGGLLLRALELPQFRNYALDLEKPGAIDSSATATLGNCLRDVFRTNEPWSNFRLFGPDERASNKLSAVLEATDKIALHPQLPTDEHIGVNGRVMEILSEHVCQGWLEAYLLTGRHGLFSSYEGFIHVIDSMFNQHAKWLEAADMVTWRQPVASLNYLLTSHTWGQDRNGFTHQNPGLISHVLNKTADFIRVYLPPDANTLLTVTDECLRSRNRVNVIIAQHKPSPQWLDMKSAIAHCAAGVSVWDWASNQKGTEPNVIVASAGDVPTLEALAAVDYLHTQLPDLQIRFINVVNLTRLLSPSQYSDGLADAEYDAIFTPDKPVIFAFHGYASLIYSLTFARSNHRNLHVYGYREEGDLTTPFDMRVQNRIDRFHLAEAMLDHVPGFERVTVSMKQDIQRRLAAHAEYIVTHGQDLPESRNWKWPGPFRGS